MGYVNMMLLGVVVFVFMMIFYLLLASDLFDRVTSQGGEILAVIIFVLLLRVQL